MDAIANLAISTVAGAPAPSDTGNTLTVSPGHGVRFPAVPFNAVVCPVGVLPDPTNAEIVRVTAVVGDVFTITRAQEGTAPHGVIVGDLIFAAITAKMITDIITLLESHAARHTNGSDDIQNATAAQKGLATAAQITKLDGIEAGADVTDEENVGDAIYGTVAKTALADDDDVPVLDSTAAYALSRILYKDLRKVRTKTVTNTYTMDTTTTDEVIVCNRPTAFNLTLVDATTGIGLTHRGRKIQIKNIGAGTVSLLSAAGSQIFTTEAEARVDLLTGDAAALVCNGTYWLVI